VITLERQRSVNAGPRNIAARRLIGGAMTVAVVSLLSGCYAFIPTTSTTLAAATPVTVKLSAAGSVAMAQALGNAVDEIEGAVLRSSADSLVVAVENTYTTNRQKFSTTGTTAAIPRPYIEQVEVRTFSRKRTVLMIIGGVVLGAAAGASVAAGGGNSPPGNGGTTPP
jgi:hypothetical protein